MVDLEKLDATHAKLTCGWYSNVGDGPGIISSIVGALILLGAYRVIVGMRAGR